MFDEGYTEPLPGDRHVGGLGGGTIAEQVFFGHYRLGRPRGGYEHLTGTRGKWARLTLFPEGFRIEAGPLTFKAAVPTWEARYEELKDVSAVGTFPFRPGARFYVGPASHDLIIFYTFGRKRLLRMVAVDGVTVNFAPVRFFYV